MLTINDIISKSIESHRQSLISIVYDLKSNKISLDIFIDRFMTELKHEYIREWIFITKKKYISSDDMDFIEKTLQKKEIGIKEFAERVIESIDYNDVTEFAESARYIYNIALQNILNIELPFIPNNPESNCKRCQGYWEFEEINNHTFAFWNISRYSCDQCKQYKSQYNPIGVSK